MSDEASVTIPSPWTLDANGFLLTASGVRAARLDAYGTIWLWDKRTKAEVPFTRDNWQWCQTQTQGAESHETRETD
jgi:hypothetical protein